MKTATRTIKLTRENLPDDYRVGSAVERIEIRRVEAPERRGIAKCGNLGTQAMTYKWHVIVNGELMATQSRLKDAKDAASYYGAECFVTR